MNLAVTTAGGNKWGADWRLERESHEIRQISAVSNIAEALGCPARQTPKPAVTFHVALAEMPPGSGCPGLCPLVPVCCHSTEGPSFFCVCHSFGMQKFPGIKPALQQRQHCALNHEATRELLEASSLVAS